ncbi:hypothetical protein D3C86_1798120 [compost metagenome]
MLQRERLAGDGATLMVDGLFSGGQPEHDSGGHLGGRRAGTQRDHTAIADGGLERIGGDHPRIDRKATNARLAQFDRENARQA